MFHAVEIKSLVVKQEERLQAKLMQGMKHTFPIRKFILFWLNRLHELEGQAVSKPETMALDAKFVGEAEGDNGCLV